MGSDGAAASQAGAAASIPRGVDPAVAPGAVPRYTWAMRIALLLGFVAAFLSGIGAWALAITGDVASADGGRGVWIAAGAALAALVLITGFVLLIIQTRPRG